MLTKFEKIYALLLGCVLGGFGGMVIIYACVTFFVAL